MPGQSEKTERFTLRIPNDLMRRLREVAAGGSVARVIINKLEQTTAEPKQPIQQRETTQ